MFQTISRNTQGGTAHYIFNRLFRQLGSAEEPFSKYEKNNKILRLRLLSVLRLWFCCCWSIVDCYKHCRCLNPECQLMRTQVIISEWQRCWSYCTNAQAGLCPCGFQIWKRCFLTSRHIFFLFSFRFEKTKMQNYLDMEPIEWQSRQYTYNIFWKKK